MKKVSRIVILLVSVLMLLMLSGCGEKDETPPTISGFDDKVDVTCGTSFNLNDYIAENIKIEDDVTESITEYSIASDDVYDRGSGVINTMEAGEHEVTVTAQDESENEGKATFILSINPVVVSADDPHPVIYDGEYGVIKLKEFNHGDPYGNSDIKGYYAVFDVENKCEVPVSVYWSMYTSINDYQVNPVFELDALIASGKKGTALTYFEDSNIPEDAGNFSQIDSIVCICKDGESESFFRVPVTFYTDAVGK